ncbi:MAG: hypothetical protein ACRDRJ_03460 [Streptosporangiaceae bacterium]
MWSFYDDVDAVPAYVVLDGHLPIAPGHDLLQNVTLELGFTRLEQVARWRGGFSGIPAVADEGAAQVAVGEVLRLSGVDDPPLLPSPGCSDVDAPHCSVAGHPGSPLLAMMLLGRACRYVFCDTDPASVADLRAARERFGLRDEVRVIHGDGLAETTALLQAHAIGAASLVHVDPFDFRAAGPGVASALELVTCLAAASIPTFAWYGLTAPSAAHELP